MPLHARWCQVGVFSSNLFIAQIVFQLNTDLYLLINYRKFKLVLFFTLKPNFLQQV